jgi:hypothetical protein
MDCRRCIICQDQDHHWLEYEPKENESDPDPIPDFICMHCPAIGDACDRCDGTGFDDWEDEDGEDDPSGDDGICDECDGRAVLERKPT